MKFDKIKLKWKIFGYILIFTVIIIMVFCFFQIFMLEKMYKSTKTNQVADLFTEIETRIINTNDLNDLRLLNDLQTSATDYETAIYLFNLDGDEIITINNGDYYQKLKDESIFQDIVNKALATSKWKQFYIIFDNNVPAPNKMDYPIIHNAPISSIDTAIISGKFIELNQIRYLLILDSRLTPVAPAIKTLKQQLLYISAIVIILAIIVALLIANIISKPIRIINEDAKQLALGKRNINFNGNGYAEIAELNNTLNYAVAELKKTDELQKELLANISHDLKTPITLISGYAEMMKDLPDEFNADNLQLIIDECNRLNSLVLDLLDLSRLQSKTINFKLVEFNLTDLIKSIVIRNQQFLENTGFVINFKYDMDVFINADYDRIGQVIYNFITNAVNYSKDKKIIDIIQIINDDRVRIIVKDYGIGIKPEEQALIWNRYYRIDKTHNRSNKGTGLGLAIVKEILDFHGFEYGVESKYHEGSSFYFELPYNKKV